MKQEKLLEKLQEKGQKTVLHGKDGPNSDFIGAQT